MRSYEIMWHDNYKISRLLQNILQSFTIQTKILLWSLHNFFTKLQDFAFAKFHEFAWHHFHNSSIAKLHNCVHSKCFRRKVLTTSSWNSTMQRVRTKYLHMIFIILQNRHKSRNEFNLLTWNLHENIWRFRYLKLL
jgi:AAA+ ATPase superfamily predicted ATPase